MVGGAGLYYLLYRYCVGAGRRTGHELGEYRSECAGESDELWASIFRCTLLGGLLHRNRSLEEQTECHCVVLFLYRLCALEQIFTRQRPTAISV